MTNYDIHTENQIDLTERLGKMKHPLARMVCHMIETVRIIEESELWFIAGLALEDGEITHPKKQTGYNSDGYDPYHPRYRAATRPSKLLGLLKKHVPRWYEYALENALWSNRVHGDKTLTREQVEDTETFAHEWALLEKQAFTIQLEEDVHAVYSEEKFGSCMHGKQYPRWYEQMGMRVVTLRRDGKLKARALVWEALDSGGDHVTLMDRIYPSDTNETPHVKALIDWAKDNVQDWKAWQSIDADWANGGDYRVIGVPEPAHGYPYMDSFGWLTVGEDGIKTIYTDEPEEGEHDIYKLKSTSGEAEEHSMRLETFYCEWCGEWEPLHARIEVITSLEGDREEFCEWCVIHRDRGVYVESHQAYYAPDLAVYSDEEERYILLEDAYETEDDWVTADRTVTDHRGAQRMRGEVYPLASGATWIHKDDPDLITLVTDDGSAYYDTPETLGHTGRPDANAYLIKRTRDLYPERCNGEAIARALALWTDIAELM